MRAKTDSQSCISEEESAYIKTQHCGLVSGFSALDMAGGDGAESGLGSRHPRPSVEQLLPVWPALYSVLTVQEESGWRCWMTSCPARSPAVTCRHTVFLPIPSTQHRWIQFSHFSASIVECAPLSPRTYLSPSLWANQTSPAFYVKCLPQSTSVSILQLCHSSPFHPVLDLKPSKNVGAHILWV